LKVLPGVPIVGRREFVLALIYGAKRLECA
jgi:hypothetical protein